MKYIDLISLNMLKSQLLIVYQTFHDLPELLKDPIVGRCYSSLLSVTDLHEFHQWENIMETVGLSFSNTNGMERRQNVLGELLDMASKTDSSTLLMFLGWKESFDPLDWERICERNCERVRQVQALASRNYDVHIVLVNCDGQLVAIGNDADRLFEIFGWQTSSVSNGMEDVSFMFVSEYGYKVLVDRGYDVRLLQLKNSDGDDEAFLSTNFTEDLVAGYQQLIDYIRLLMKKHDEEKDFLISRREMLLPKQSYKILVEYGLNISRDSVKVTSKSGRDITIADGNSWRLDDSSLPVLLNFGQQIKKV